jgi:hypothetical protein
MRPPDQLSLVAKRAEARANIARYETAALEDPRLLARAAYARSWYADPTRSYFPISISVSEPGAPTYRLSSCHAASSLATFTQTTGSSGPQCRCQVMTRISET